jgi:hypothetical protein
LEIAHFDVRNLRAAVSALVFFSAKHTLRELFAAQNKLGKMR